METRWWLNRAYGALAEVDGLGEQGHVPIIRHLQQVQKHHCCRVKNPDPDLNHFGNARSGSVWIRNLGHNVLSNQTKATAIFEKCLMD
jgi:hypothetical protein